MTRPRLTDALEDDGWRLAMLTGGPATGKTVLAAQWFESLGPTAREWLTLDESDNRPEHFWLAFASALSRALPQRFSGTVAAVADVHRVHPDFLERLLADWSTVEEPLVVVLDDAHHLRNTEILQDLTDVVEQLPEGSRLVLTSRADPQLPMARWRARSWLTELRQQDLAFTVPETVALLHALDEYRLSSSEIEDLWQRTEGWAAGLRLAAARLKNRGDLTRAIDEFSGRDPLIADLLIEEMLHPTPDELAEFLLRTSVVHVLDAEICDALSGRADSAAVLRRLESELQFVIATGPDRQTYRYHPLLGEVLRSELERQHPEDVQALNRLAAAVLLARDDVADAVRCLLAAGDADHAFSVVFVAAYRRHDLADHGGVAALVNLFPRELVADSASRMLTYSLMLGLCGRVPDAIAWLQRAATRLDEDPAPNLRDVATLDALRLLSFTVSGELIEQVEAGQRAVAAVEAGLDLGIVGRRVRMNLVRALLLMDDPLAAERVLKSGDPGDEIAVLLLAPALAARVALRHGRLNEAKHQTESALRAAHAFDLDAHIGTIDARLAMAGVFIEQNDLSEAEAAMGELGELIERHQEALTHRVLFEIEKARLAASRRDFDSAFATLHAIRKTIDGPHRSPLGTLVLAATARWLIEVGDARAAEELIADVPVGTTAKTLLQARYNVISGRPDVACTDLEAATLPTVRDELVSELIQARAATDGHGNAGEHAARVVALAAPEQLVRLVLDEGPTVTRLIRSAAESIGTSHSTELAVALGTTPRARGAQRTATIALSERELAVLRFLPSRLTNQQIAGECLMSVNTVKTHVKSIYAKLGVSSRDEAVDQARLRGML